MMKLGESLKIHNLKISPMFFYDVVDGLKKFELRKNDRNYKVGDHLRLMQYYDGDYTGREIYKEVKYILKDCEKYGLKDGFVILGL